MQKVIHQNGNNQLENVLREHLDFLIQCNEGYWKQRSKVLWFNLADRSTKFFHQWASRRQTRNCISQIQMEDGSWIDQQQDIIHYAEVYFRELYQPNTQNNQIPRVA